MTVYAPVAGIVINVNNAPVVDGEFLGWKNSSGTSVGYNTITVGAADKVYADIDYEIYNVTIVADNGIGTVALDGIVLAKVNNTFYAYDLKAGTHTITYELKSGYEGTIKMTVDGKAVSGLSFTLSGTDDVDVNITLSGTTPSVTPTPEPSGDDGMGITEYLLIVLVVIVAARMMRS